MTICFRKYYFFCFSDIASFKTPFKNRLLGILKTGRKPTKVHLMLSPLLENCGVLLRARSGWHWSFTFVPLGRARPIPSGHSPFHPSPSEHFEGAQFITWSIPSFLSPQFSQPTPQSPFYQSSPKTLPVILPAVISPAPLSSCSPLRASSPLPLLILYHMAVGVGSEVVSVVWPV